MKSPLCFYFAFILLIVCLPSAFLMAQGQGTLILPNSQTPNPIVAAFPFLRINPDGRTGALGEAGIAISPDVGAMYHNPSKLAFIEPDMGFGLTYMPWFTGIENPPGYFSTYLSGYKRLDSLSTIGVSFNYLDLGKINLVNLIGTHIETYSPHEIIASLAYSRKLSQKTSLGIGLKYGVSNLATGLGTSGGGTIEAGKTIAADISLYHQNPDTKFLGKPATFSWGIAISNIGSKISYIDGQLGDFIPANLGLGTAIDMRMGEQSSLLLTMDISKLMVPTPDPNNPMAHRNKSVLSSIFDSFSDAPNGLKEELQELMFSFGAEYWAAQFLAVRAGYFSEHELKGRKKYLTTGLGLKYKALEVNFTYVLLTNPTSTFLDNGYRLQLNWDLK